MPEYTLTYFNIRGLGETARLMFALADQPYKDHRLQQEEWASYKSSTLFGKLPQLQVDGHTMAQARAICRYLGKKFNLIAESDLDQANGDMVADYVDEMRLAIEPYLIAFFIGQPNSQASLAKEFTATQFPIFLGKLEQRLIENKGGDGFFTGDKVTWVDLFFYNTFYLLRTSLSTEYIPDNYFKPYPKLMSLVEKIEALPRIAKWIKERPESFM